MSYQDRINQQNQKLPSEEEKVPNNGETTNDSTQKTAIPNTESLLSEEDSKTTPETLMQNLNPNKLKQLIEAHVGSGPFSEAILERKKYSFELLKVWDSKKCEALASHKNVLEIFVKKVEKKQEYLKSAMENVMKFFNQKVAQENEYINAYVKKIPKMKSTYEELLKGKKLDPEYPQQLNSQSKAKEILDHFPQFSRCFEEIDHLMQSKLKKIEAYKTTLETDILKNLLQQENKEYEKASQELRDEIIDLRKKLNSANKQTAENSTKHAKLFTEMLDPSTKNSLETKDLYNSEVALITSSEEQVRLHKAMGKEIMKFWQKLNKMEVTRMKVIQKAFQEFLVKSEEYFGPSVEYNNLRNMFVNLEYEKDLEKFLELENFFSEEEQFSLKKMIPEFSLLNFKGFLENLVIDEIEVSPLVVKEFIVERECGNLLSKSFKKCKVVLTVDNNILLFDDPQEKERKPASFILKIDNINIKRRSEMGFIELHEKVNGWIFNSTNSFVFKIDDTDVYDEMIIYIDFVKLRKWF